MKAKIIKTEADQTTLAYIDTLMDAAPETPEHKTLDFVMHKLSLTTH